MADYNILYIQGTNGRLANMDVDCDGAQGGANDDGRCASSTDTQAITSFASTVKSFNIKDLSATTHHFVVFGNENDHGKNFPQFDPRAYGVEPLSVMAVVCNNKVVYGVWGDTNGDDGPKPMVGEASISLATACFGNSINGNSGHDVDDVLYIAFPGKDAVPGSTARWAASSPQEFEDSIAALGDKLVSRIGGGSGSGSGNDTGSGAPAPPARTTTPAASAPAATSNPECTAAPVVSIPPAANLRVLDKGSSTLVLTPFLNNGAAVVPTGQPAVGGSNCNGGAVVVPSSAAAPAPTAPPAPPVASPSPSRTGRGGRRRTRTRGSGAGRTRPTSAPAAVAFAAIGECSWPGHCAGATCTTWDDCSDDLVCIQGVCGTATA